jgi:hypothetical protein
MCENKRRRSDRLAENKEACKNALLPGVSTRFSPTERVAGAFK